MSARASGHSTVVDPDIQDSPQSVPPDTSHRVLAAFRSAAAEVPAYRTVLEEHGVNVADVIDLSSFSRLCPLLSKTNTFDRFSIDDLMPAGRVFDLADVLTSSGRGGRFSFGVTTRAQAAATVPFLDAALDSAFEIKSRRTLAINCLPMGVGFSSQVMTLATTSVREDMATALVQTFGAAYDQILLVGDPLFLKRLTDHAAAVGLDWSRYRVNVIVGEEIFGERYRTYLSACVGADLDRSDGGYVMSSFGVGELGLHLGFETRATIGLRRAAHADATFARELFGRDVDNGDALPMLFAFNPLRTFLEIVDADAAGYGQLTTSMLDPDRCIPLLRYQTGDVAALVDPDRVAALAARHGVTLHGPVPRALFALSGRQTEVLPTRSHVGVYKDALYADQEISKAVTGAVRVIAGESQCTMHVQLVPTAMPSAFLHERIMNSVPNAARPSRVVLWPYAQFPFGMTLDYERKFAYYVPGEPEPVGLPSFSR